MLRRSVTGDFKVMRIAVLRINLKYIARWHYRSDSIVLNIAVPSKCSFENLTCLYFRDNNKSTQAEDSSSSSHEPVLSIHWLVALNLGTGVEQPFDCLIIQKRQAMPSTGRSMDWTLEENNGWLSVLLHHTHKAQKGPYSICVSRSGNVRHRCGGRLCRTHAVLGRAIPWGWVPTMGMKVRNLAVLSKPPHSIGDRPERSTSVAVDRWIDELLCGGYKWVSWFEMPFIPTCWTGECWVEQMSRLHGTAC